jgi:hypothetical protein
MAEQMPWMMRDGGEAPARQEKPRSPTRLVLKTLLPVLVVLLLRKKGYTKDATQSHHQEYQEPEPSKTTSSSEL